MQQPPFYNQPNGIPLQPPRRSIWRRFRSFNKLVQIAIGVVLFFSCSFCSLVVVAGIVGPPKTSTSLNAPIATRSIPVTTPTRPVVQPTLIPTQAVVKPTAVPTKLPTVQPTKVPDSLSATHGTPHVGGPVSDFAGKYGQPFRSQPGDITWLLTDNQYGLTLHYDTSGKVNFISYLGPDNWSKAQYRDYLLTFAPGGFTENTAANTSWQNGGGDPYDPIAYDSPIGKFVLHVSDGTGWMNTI